MTLFFIFLGLIVFYFALIYLIGFLVFKKICGRQDEYDEVIDRKLVEHCSEDLDFYKSVSKSVIRIKAKDKTDLAAIYIKSKNPSHKYIIAMHGYHSIFLESIRIANHFHEKDFNYLLACERAHHLSAGKYLTFGIKESDDLISWINYVISIDPEAEIMLYGFSMGGATVLLTLGKKLPKNVKCAVTDAAYGNIKSVLVNRMAKQMKLSIAKFLYFCLDKYANLIGYDFSFNTRDALKKSKTPILLIHGDNDELVPFSFLDYHFKSIPVNVYHKKQVFKGSMHCKSNIDYKDEYLKTVDDFVEKFFLIMLPWRNW